MRVVVTRIWTDGTMYRRMVDTAQQSDPWKWADLTARALAAQPPYRPVPGTAVYHVCADGCTVQAGEYDLHGPLRIWSRSCWRWAANRVTIMKSWGQP
ncbi:MAG TPA: hypothetical protein VEH31_30115 [Streptosporangiaceae bacterium]|nr:hypothetical protein [Streptosporangiaceae bacterium]